MGVPRREIWVAVDPKEDAMHVLEHEGDYEPGDILVKLTPSRAIGVKVEITVAE